MISGRTDDAIAAPLRPDAMTSSTGTIVPARAWWLAAVVSICATPGLAADAVSTLGPAAVATNAP